MTEIRGWRALADYADREMRSVREWTSRGLPCEMDGNVHVFKHSEIDEFMSNLERSLDDDDSGGLDSEDIKFHKLRQEKHKANELEWKEKIRLGEYSPVSEFEETTVVLLQQVRRLMIEVVAEIKKEAKLTGSKAEEIDAMLITGFNQIADIDFSE